MFGCTDRGDIAVASSCPQPTQVGGWNATLPKRNDCGRPNARGEQPSASGCEPGGLLQRVVGRPPDSPPLSYVILTFQKTGAVNLRAPCTFFRNAVGWNHSPHGT